MPPRRNSRKKATPQKEAKEETDVADTEGNSAEYSEAAGNEAVVSDVKNEIADDDQNIEETTEHNNPLEEEKPEVPEVNQQDDSKMTPENVNNGSMDLPYKVKVSHLPATYVLKQFKQYIEVTFNISIPNIISPANNSPWLLIPFATKEEQENLIRLLHNHVWKKKALRAIAFHALEPVKRRLEDGDDENDKKNIKLDENLVLTLEEEILSESLPLYSVPYEEQNRFTIQDVELLSNKLHAFMCVRNPALAGWAEAMCEKNNGFIYKIEPLKPSPILEGYRNKCKFRIGINADGEITVGFCLNDNENKILGVQPGDKLIHLPDSMKYAAKKFEEFIRTSGKEQYDKKKRSGFWDHIIIRVAPAGELMLVVVMYHNSLPDEEITNIKKEVKEFFTNGEGKDCKLFSLYFQVMNDKPPMLLPDKLELLMGEPSFEENICGLRFHVGPFSILNVNSPSAENIYKSIIELAEPTPESTIIDICSGTGGIAFTIAHLCKQVIAIESQEDNVNDALKTKKLNNIQNVEFIKAKVEDALSGIFAKLGDSPIIPIIDPPRQGLVQKAISLLRSNKGINKLVYVCSNSKMGVKNFLDLCASSDKKEGTFGNPLNVEFAGLPFLPVKAVPVDVAPYTVNNTIIILFERIDPSTFPPAKNPPPVPLKKPQAQKDEKKKPRKGQGSKRGGRAFFRQQGKRGRGRKFPGQGGRGGAIGGLGGRGGRFAGNPKRGGMGFNNQNRMGRFPPPLMRPVDPALSLVAKYERRIAELEQQDRAFKAGLTMGLQALGSRTSGGPGHGPGPGPGGDFGNFGNSNNNSFRNMGYFPQNESFGGFNKDNFGQFDRGDRNAWQRNNNPGRNNFGASGNVGNIGNMSNMSSMGSMGNMGNMSNMSNMNNMNNMSNMNNMNNMNPMNNMNNMSNMSSMSSMSSMGNSMGNGFGGGGNSAGGNSFGGNFGGGGGGAGVGGFNSFGGNSNFGNFGAGGGSFNSNFGGGNNFRNYQGNKNRRQC